MGQIEDLRLFSDIVEQGSISKAAAKLHIAKSAVSRRLNLLEQRYGARLISREPGSWEVTTMGRELYQRSLDVLMHADEIESDFTEANQSLAGPLTVSVPREFGLSYLSPFLMAFKARHPEIQLMVDFDDRKVDLSRDNYDFAVRISSELEPNVVARLIGASKFKICATPNYLKSRGAPKNLQDLEQHDLMQFQSTRRAVWFFKNSAGVTKSHEFQPSLNSNSGVFLLDAVLNDLGIARLPDFICQHSLEAGDLVPVLTDLVSPQLQIHLIHTEERRLNRRMRLFADEIETACSPS